MKNENQNFTDDEIAKNEPHVEPCKLLAEIEPLLKDYFKEKCLLTERPLHMP